MQKKLISLISATGFIFATCAFAAQTTQDAKKAPEVKPANQSMQMPKMPEIDPKTWDFLPATVATIGTTKISKEELLKVLVPQARMMVMMGQKPTPEQYKDLAVGITQELIKAKIVEGLAKDAGYTVTPAFEDKTYNDFIANMKKQMPNAKDFDFAKMIEKQGLTVADVKHQMAEGAAVQEWVKAKIQPSINISDADVKAFYDKNKDTYFKKPETVTASHILFKPDLKPEWEKDPAKYKTQIDDAFAKAKVEADKVYKMLEEKKITFADAAKKYSQGPSAKNGGELGTFTKGQMVPAFEKACWDLVKKGMKGYEEVKTQFGWHIVEVTAYTPAGYIPLDATLTKEIKSKLEQDATIKAVNALIDAQTKKLNPVVEIKNDASAAPVKK